VNKKIIIILIVTTVFSVTNLCTAQKLSSQYSTTYEASEGALLFHLKRVLEVLTQNSDNFKIDFNAGLQVEQTNKNSKTLPQPHNKHKLQVSIIKNGPETLAIRLLNSWHDVGIFRNASTSELILPDAKVKFVGKGELENQQDSLKPSTLINRLFTAETSLSSILTLMKSDYSILLLKHIMLPDLMQVTRSSAEKDTAIFKAGKSLKIEISSSDTSFIVIKLKLNSPLFNRFDFIEITLNTRDFSEPLPFWSAQNFKEIIVQRSELEKMVFRAFKRFLEIRYPGATQKPSPQKVAKGELRYHGGQCLVLLSGSPEEIGKAQGLLLDHWIRQVVDSTIYLVGLFETISQGKWFLSELDRAWESLNPHIPDRHKREMYALASACPQISQREIRLSNIFPEYFHCSGFALFGRATADESLYHGRILDYMTEIGLQNNAVAFVVKPDNKNAFFSPGFAGIVGTVSGLNEKQISIGEMGGRGRYQWNGIPMASLMRLALEECNSLDQVKALWQNSPRTCEYFYVFADGKIPDAVGLQATPEGIEFVNSGQSHHFLGEGIPDTVILSAGKRLEILRRRIKDNYGKFTASSSMDLMDRPVAMKSNLRNVLFVPQLLKAYIAVATANEPAALQPYVEYDFKKLIDQLP
jgi:hypothetical protein